MMLRCWAEPAEGITAIEVEAAGAPHVDDIVVHRPDRRVFKQLKHKMKGRFTGADLFSEQSGEASLIGKLFRGWVAVRARGDIAVEIHLTTNAMSSADARSRLISPVDFEKNILLPVRSKAWICPDSLQPVLDEVQTLTGASDWVTLNDFLAALRLEFDAPEEAVLRKSVVGLLRSHLRPSATVETEASAWVEKVYDLSTRHPETGPLLRSDIDRELRLLFGPARRLVEHRLALPDHHVPRLSIVGSILDAAHGLGSGYLIVLGPPGCGKTTLATWLANEHDDQLLMRYHVFDPRQASVLERRGRASALEFVRTIFDVLSERFPAEIAPHIPAEETLSNAVDVLRKELGRLAGDRPRLLVIDGIDHVVRSRVKTSLFEALPDPAPPNVVFVLFGQPDWEYPGWLTRAKCILIPAFTKQETRLHVCSRMGWSLEELGAAAIGDTLHEKSGGNPLSLFYNLAVVETLGSTPEDVATPLQKTSLFGSAPHQEYDRLLDDLDGLLPTPRDSESLRRDLLACFAVAIAAVTEERLRSAFTDDGLTLRQARDFLTKLRPVVVEREPGQFWLFHDDFRRYAEERTSATERAAAHRSLARALQQGWQGEELGAWVEHLWLGGENDHLANLPSEHSLAQWFQAAPRGIVVTMHRFALAAAFRLTREVDILRNALAFERSTEAADLPQADRGGVPPELGLKGWSFVVPPLGADPSSLQRRASAIQAAANGCERDPSLATEIAARFFVPEDLIPEPEDFGDSGIQAYIAAVARWLLRSGDLAGARRLAGSERFGALAISAFGAEFSAVADVDVLATWADAMAGINEWLDRDLAEAALLHIVGGREQCALSITRALAWCPSPSAETKRDAAVLFSLIETENVTERTHLAALVRWSERNWMQPEEWREFFFHGFVFSAAGPVNDLALYEFPARFKKSVSENSTGAPNMRLAEFLWRCGCAAGLARRGQDLLTPQEFERFLATFTGQEEPNIEPFQRYTFLGFVKVYLPLIALAVRCRSALLAKARELIVPAARECLTAPDARTYGLLEAAWLIDPAAWRSMATEAHAVALLPGTEAAERVEWFRYWADRGARRGVVTPEVFLARSAIAALGVPRKTDPADLAVEILCGSTDSSLDKVEGVRRLVDLLAQLKAEPEGGRAARRQLPYVLALALQLDPSLFRDEFLRSTVEFSVAEPFEDIAAEIIVQWLAADETTTATELLALWHWMASCPSAFGRDSSGVAASRMIIQRLTELGAHNDALKIGQWLVALAPRESEQSMPSPTPRSQPETVGEQDVKPLGENPDGGRTGTQSEDYDPSAPSGRSLPNINEVSARWFFPWWSSMEHKVLREFLASGGEQAWEWVCKRIADQIATGSEYGGDEAGLTADSLRDLRPRLSMREAFEIAIRHLAEKVQFQGKPGQREGAGIRQTRLEVLVSLIARGIDLSDVETLRRALRSLGALARSSAAAPVVEQEMLIRLGSDEPRAVVHSLLVLRQIRELTQETLEKISSLKEHADIWCRWLSCRILDIEPKWPELRVLTAPLGPISPEVSPTLYKPGEVYYADTTSAREIYLRKLGALLEVDEEDLRSWLELEFRGLPALPARSSGWHYRKAGSTLTNNRMAEAAGRLACRLASTVPSAVLPALMSIVARQDPWLAVAEPAIQAPEGWIEVCQCKHDPSDTREEYLLRSIGLVHKDLTTQNGWLPERVAKVSSALLAPTTPKEFGWVAERWPEIASPQLEGLHLLPLSFLNSLFTELGRDRFSLVPRWDLPPFGDLRFDVGDVPRWVHPKLGSVLVGAYREYLVDGGGPGHPIVAWQTGWYASPTWLESFLQSKMRLVRFWRLEWRARHWGKTEGDSTVEYGLQEDVINQN